MARLSLGNPALYINRQESWLAFNRRVLEEALNPANPLLERVKFLAISASNLDEFFEIQVAGLLQRIEDGHLEPDADGLSPVAERELIAREAHALVADQFGCWNHALLPALRAQGIRIRRLHELGPAARTFVRRFASREIDPLLTPVTIDPAHPFPHAINKALCLALLLRRRGRRSGLTMGVITIPRALPRLVRLPSNGDDDFIFLTELVAAHAETMYRGYQILGTAGFRVTRNSNLYLAEEESRDVMEIVRSEVLNRRKGEAVRLEIEAGAPEQIVQQLRTNFELDDWQVFQNTGPVSLPRIFHLYKEVDRPDLKFRPFAPREPRLTRSSTTLFDELRRRDLLLHHPFDSYEPVIAFLETAARDPRVLSIKQTLYRTNEDSPVVKALLEAATHKEVTVVVELMARFDEASNIRWARNLQDGGVQVFHGLVGLKTHCKLSLLARRDEDGEVRRYAHLGTGNYNPETARLYTDLSLMTADPELTAGVDAVFNYLTAYAERGEPQPLLVAPIHMAGGWLALIEREIGHARRGRPARLIAKMNGLLDKTLIQALYRASRAGVQIDLLIRGMCALRPGIRGTSDHIRVISVVGRLLEHSRIVYFENGGDEEIYLTSADWMPRNLYGRAEVAFPLRMPELRRRVRDEILAAYLADTAKARWLQRDGRYLGFNALPASQRRQVRAHQVALLGPNAPRIFNAQEYLIELAEAKPVAAPDPEPAPRPAAAPERLRSALPAGGNR